MRQLYQKPVGGYVYVIWAIGTRRYKIGRSKDASRRLEQLNQQSCYLLQLMDSHYFDDCEKHERRLHNMFWQYKVHGEWFELPEEFLTQLEYWLKNPEYLNVQVLTRKKGVFLVQTKFLGKNTKAQKLLYTQSKDLDLAGLLNNPSDLERAIVLVGCVAKGTRLSPEKNKELKSLVGIKISTTEEATGLKQQLKDLRKNLISPDNV